MEQNFQDIYEQLQSRIRQAEDKRLQLKAKGTVNLIYYIKYNIL